MANIPNELILSMKNQTSEATLTKYDVVISVISIDGEVINPVNIDSLYLDDAVNYLLTDASNQSIKYLAPTTNFSATVATTVLDKRGIVASGLEDLTVVEGEVVDPATPVEIDVVDNTGTAVDFSEATTIDSLE